MKASQTYLKLPKTSDQEILELKSYVKDLEERIKILETAVRKIPDPIVIYYRPPNNEDHIKLSEALDDLYNRINKIEEH